MLTIFLKAVVQPLMAALFLSFLLAMRKLFIWLCPEGRFKKLMLTELWLTDPERHARERAGIFPPPKPPRARTLRWASAGYRAGRWLRRKLD